MVMRSDLDAYLDALYLERGLSEATLRAYRVDLEGVSAYARSLDKTIEALTDADINGFIGSLFSKGLRIPSIQRKLSALRGFYKYQIRHGRREDDPMARIQRPSKGRSLPKTLSESDVFRLLEAPDTDTLIGLRDRTMLEVLYASGLRVTELCGLERSNINLAQGAIRVLGKGNKERLVPLGDVARDWLQRYFRDARPEFADPRGVRGISRAIRRSHDETDFLAPITAHCSHCGDHCSFESTYASSCVRDSSGEPRSRSSSGSVAFRS